MLPSDPTGALHTGDVWLVLDGLNEMGASGKDHAERLREWFKSPDGPARVVIACRAGDYASPDLQLGDIPTVKIQELKESQIRRFTANYLGDKAQAFLERVLPGPRADHGGTLLPLARNPYLLSALIIVFERAEEGDLPRNTGTLFRGLARALWERERKRGTPGWIPYDQAESAFAALAFAMIDEDRETAVPQAYAEKKLGDSGLLLTGVSANYLARDSDGGTIRFYHQLMQEFFAAVRLRQFVLRGQLQEPEYGYMSHRIYEDPLTSRRFPTKWDEVVVALCGIIDDPSKVVSHVLMTDPVLAARCVDSGVLLDLETRRKIRDHLIAELRGNDWRVVGSVAVALGHINDREAVPQLLAILREEPEKGRHIVVPGEAAAKVLGELGGSEAVAGLRNALNCVSARIRARAAQALGVIGDPAAVPDLIFHLGDADSTGVAKGTASGCMEITTQDTAAWALVQIAERSPDAVVPSVIDALRSPYAPTRKKAAEVLARVCDQRAVPGLSDALTYDVDPSVRRATATALSWIKTGPSRRMWDLWDIHGPSFA